jgi:hypothetical protein
MLSKIAYLCDIIVEPLKHRVMEKRKVSIDIAKANFFAIALLIGAAIVFGIPFLMIWGKTQTHWPDQLSMSSNPWSLLWVLLAYLLGIVIHELIHGITWSFFAPNGWRSISFGVIWKMLTPYCHCDDPMRRRGYLWGAMMPCIVVGVIPAIISLLSGSLVCLVWGIFFISAAAGDIWMSWLLLKEKPGCLVLDHPNETAFYVFDEE